MLSLSDLGFRDRGETKEETGPMKLRNLLLPLLLASVTIAPALADDVTGEEDLLCAVLETYECDPAEEGGCAARPAAALNVPLFLEIELDEKLLHSTESSELDRSTEIRHVESKDGRVYLQGEDFGRAFSMVIDEASGMGTLSITVPGEVIVLHTSCTEDDD